MAVQGRHPLAALLLVSAALCQVASQATVTAPTLPSSGTNRTFAISYPLDAFVKDGQPFQIISGSLHYFRVPRVYWRDRLRKMRQAGLNTVATYVEWSSHEPEPGQYTMTGELDLLHFIQVAEEEGLLVNLRVGPYICAERDMGGLPYWLLTVKPDIKLRSRDPVFQRYVERWLDELMPVMKPRLYGNGGPIILVQVENEYGSYPACDRQYLLWLRDLFRRHVGSAAVLYTTDGAGASYLKCGKIPGVYATVDFGAGSNPQQAFAAQRAVEPRGPLVNSEYYTGWLTHWNEAEQRVPTDKVLGNLHWFMQNGASFNFYVFMGGTNFGFTAGANWDKGFRPQLTSYDYDAPLTEAGDPTNKYFAIRDAILSYTGNNVAGDRPSPRPSPKLNFGPVVMQRTGDLTTMLTGKAENDVYPNDFETLRQSFGFIKYETRIPPDFVPRTGGGGSVLRAPRLRDRGVVFLGQLEQEPTSQLFDEERQGVLCRGGPRRLELALSGVEPGQRLSIFVENQGRINYGGFLNDSKGLGNVTLDGRVLTNWTMFHYPLDVVVRQAERELTRRLRTRGMATAAATGTATGIAEAARTRTRPRPNDPKRDYPGVYAGRFVLPEAVGAGSDPNAPLPDTFLDTTGWGKGVAFLNGFNLGRYWPSVGPQTTLYVPGYLLRRHPAKNRLVAVEIDLAPEIPRMSLVSNFMLNAPICGNATTISCC